MVLQRPILGLIRRKKMDELKKIYEDNKNIVKLTAFVIVIVVAMIWGEAPSV